VGPYLHFKDRYCILTDIQRQLSSLIATKSDENSYVPLLGAIKENLEPQACEGVA
jgi:hypothetical protein